MTKSITKTPKGRKILKGTPDCSCLDTAREMEHPYFYRRIRKEEHYDLTHLTALIIGIMIGALIAL